MEHMRKALLESLSSQWAAQQKREAEIASLAHDLKTPLTLVGGNAELLLDEDLSEAGRKKVEAIVAGNNRARHYVASLLETASGADEAFENISLSALFDELCKTWVAIAESKKICIQTLNKLTGTGNVQKDGYFGPWVMWSKMQSNIPLLVVMFFSWIYDRCWLANHCTR